MLANRCHTEKIRHGYFPIPPIQEMTITHFGIVVKFQCSRCVSVAFPITRRSFAKRAIYP